LALYKSFFLMANFLLRHSGRPPAPPPSPPNTPPQCRKHPSRPVPSSFIPGTHHRSYLNRSPFSPFPMPSPHLPSFGLLSPQLPCSCPSLLFSSKKPPAVPPALFLLQSSLLNLSCFCVRSSVKSCTFQFIPFCGIEPFFYWMQFLPGWPPSSHPSLCIFILPSIQPWDPSHAGSRGKMHVEADVSPLFFMV